VFYVLEFFLRAELFSACSNAKLYNPVGSVVHDAAIKSNEIFRYMVQDLKERKIIVAKKSFAKASAKPNSTVAALVVRNNRLKLKKSLASSAGTLLVVPSVLLEHWQVCSLVWLFFTPLGPCHQLTLPMIESLRRRIS
jgi:hypothetical protein